MTYMLNNLDEAVDRKFLVTKPMKAQAEPGSIIHVLDVKDRKKDGYLVEYRVTDVGKGYSFRDYAAKFNSVKDFCNWARPDNFIARHYEAFDLKEIHNYIKVTDRSFVTSGLPLVVVLAVAERVALAVDSVGKSVQSIVRELVAALLGIVAVAPLLYADVAVVAGGA